MFAHEKLQEYQCMTIATLLMLAEKEQVRNLIALGVIKETR
jgi:hypothetical protein